MRSIYIESSCLLNNSYLNELAFIKLTFYFMPIFQQKQNKIFANNPNIVESKIQKVNKNKA